MSSSVKTLLIIMFTFILHGMLFYFNIERYNHNNKDSTKILDAIKELENNKICQEVVLYHTEKTDQDRFLTNCTASYYGFDDLYTFKHIAIRKKYNPCLDNKIDWENELKKNEK